MLGRSSRRVWESLIFYFVIQAGKIVFIVFRLYIYAFHEFIRKYAVLHNKTTNDEFLLLKDAKDIR